jgi:hypothetical protein
MMKVFTNLIKDSNVMSLTVCFCSFLPKIWMIQKQYLIHDRSEYSLRIRHNHEFQWKYGHLGYWNYSIERQRYSTLLLVEALIEVYLSANELQTNRDEYSWATNILDAEYKQVIASLDDIIKKFQNLGNVTWFV